MFTVPLAGWLSDKGNQVAVVFLQVTCSIHLLPYIVALVAVSSQGGQLTTSVLEAAWLNEGAGGGL